jgi:archaellum biogenesis ATPase FlaH
VKETVNPGTVRYAGLALTPTGIQGLDELNGVGLPKGRSTLLCGSAGSGKTLLAMGFLVRGVKEFQEPGVFVAFEEQPEEMTVKFSSLDHDLKALMAQDKLAIESAKIHRRKTPVHAKLHCRRRRESGPSPRKCLEFRMEHEYLSKRHYIVRSRGGECGRMSGEGGHST